MHLSVSLLSQLGPRQRYLLGYVLLLGAGAVALALIMPGEWRAIGAMWLVGLGAGWVITRVGKHSIRRRLRRLRSAADAIGRGELDHRIELQGQDEFAKLADSLDRMAARLETHLHEREALQKELARVERLAVLGELAAMVAHEVNNPLDGLQNAVRILRRTHSDNVQSGELLKLMEDGLKRIERIVQRLLALARPAQLQIEAVQVNEVVDDALLFVQPRLNRNSIQVQRDVPAEPLMVQADRMQLAQVMINLMLNAADAMPEGGQVTIAGHNGHDERGNDRVVLEVSDTGTGIKAEDLPHVFEPFYTTKRNGTGLGLAIVARIVEAHEGRVDVQSKICEGTTFRIELPGVVPETGNTRSDAVTPV